MVKYQWRELKTLNREKTAFLIARVINKKFAKTKASFLTFS